MAYAVNFYLDEHIPHAVAHGLTSRGVDVLTVTDTGLSGATDEEQLKWARLHGRVFATYDDDLLRLHAEGKPHAGIAFASRSTTVDEMIRMLMLIHQLLDPIDMEDHVEFI